MQIIDLLHSPVICKARRLQILLPGCDEFLQIRNLRSLTQNRPVLARNRPILARNRPVLVRDGRLVTRNCPLSYT